MSGAVNGVALKLGSSIFFCDIADTPSTQAEGLRRYAHLEPDEGMIFVFDNVGPRTFHQGGVGYSLDLLGLDAASRITKIVASSDPKRNERWYFSGVAAVLEVPGGTCDRVGVKVGDMVTAVDERVADEKVADSQPEQDYLTPAEVEKETYPIDAPADEYFHDLWPNEMADKAFEDRVDSPVTRRAQEDSGDFGNVVEFPIERTTPPSEDYSLERPNVTLDPREFMSRIQKGQEPTAQDYDQLEAMQHWMMKMHHFELPVPQEDKNWADRMERVLRVYYGLLERKFNDHPMSVVDDGETTASLRSAQLDLAQYEDEWKSGKSLEQTLEDVENILEFQSLRPDIERSLMKICNALRKQIDLKRTSSRSAQIVDEAKFVDKISNIVFSHADELEQRWEDDRLNGGKTQRAVITREDLINWLGGDASNEGIKYITRAASDERGLKLIGDAFLLAGMADQTNVGFANRKPFLVLRRSRNTSS